MTDPSTDSTLSPRVAPPAPDALDVDALRGLLDGRWAAVRADAREHLRGELFRPPLGLGREAHRAHVLEALKALAASGRPRAGFAAAYGGSDDIGAGVVSLEMLGYGDLSLMVKAGVQWGLFGGAIQALGTERHHERYLRDVMDGRLLGCFAMTETGHGSDVAALHTVATYDAARGCFDLHTPDASGRKDYIGNAARDGRMAVVFAQLDAGGEGRGVHAFLVPIRDESGRPCPGVTIEDCGDKEGLQGVDNGRLSFHHVRVPREMLLDRYGQVAADGSYSSPIASRNARFFTMLGALVRGRVGVAGAAGSATRTALTIAIRYAEQRRQFARPGGDDEVVLLDYLAHQRRLLPALATSYALQFAQEELLGELHDTQTGGSTDEARQRALESRAAGIKAAATWHATRTIQTCREACGGSGYLADSRLPQLKADTDVFTTFEGDNTVLLQLVAKGLLTQLRDHFGELDTLGTLRFVTAQALTQVAERTAARSLISRLVAAAPGRDDDADLHDRGWQISLLEWREKHVLEGLARRLRRAGREGADAFEVFNAAQDHVLLAARVHVDRVVLEAFVAGIARCEDPGVAALLSRVCDLHVLSVIEADKGWFLEHGRLSPGRTKAITAAVNDLCRELRPYAGVLLDGWAIPDEWLASSLVAEQSAAG